ncbi:hypothetical protein Rsub_06250 [Raphidocelis subcapitata]|uniref:Uncharacterized protein n=1 Tax=Raphidocelis subcapitata TaxID=307507 RepID=A0A2V0P6P8_9CHLO|nr:hypothetical protein Rsub_06250 [Raphidocelis subcapitata]|eukprot:GBF93530.1 hypothetical protein Rsub_06250 [Raphidocelis subcapitata]
MDLGNDAPKKKKSFRETCRRFGVCASVSPLVPLACTLLVATGLPIWAIFTRRALASTRSAAAVVFGGPTPPIDYLALSVDWITQLGVIIVASVVGLLLVVSLLRTFQEAAQLPTTRCGTPGRLSYGTYATFIAPLTFALWLVTICVALAIAGQLAWLTLAFVVQAALTMGVQPHPAGAVAPQAYRKAATAALSALASAPAAPAAAGPLAKAASDFAAAAAKQGALAVCPASCLDLGAFAAAAGATGKCVCASGEQFAEATAAVGDTWRFLVHALAALALMGLACLWLLMNASATFAHARRDMREAATGTNARATSRDGASDGDAAALYVNPTFGRSPEKRGRGGAPRDTYDADTTARAPLGASYGYALPEPALEPAAADSGARDCYATGGPVAGAPEEDVAAAPALADAGAGVASPSRAQRYAAYRLRAAQVERRGS